MLAKWWGMRLVSDFHEMHPGVPSIGSVALAAWLLWIIVSITLHELGHGWMAIRCGDTTPRDLGHMTLDPIKHMGIISLVMLAVVGIAWGLMPVNVNNLRRRHDDALVSLAGPVVNALLAVFCLLAAVASKLLLSGNAEIYAFIVFTLGLQLNIALFIFNLVPIPPLDGSSILASFVRPYRDFVRSPQSAVVGLIVMLTVGSMIIRPVLTIANQAAAVSMGVLLGLFGHT